MKLSQDTRVKLRRLLLSLAAGVLIPPLLVYLCFLLANYFGYESPTRLIFRFMTWPIEIHHYFHPKDPESSAETHHGYYRLSLLITLIWNISLWSGLAWWVLSRIEARKPRHHRTLTGDTQ